MRGKHKGQAIMENTVKFHDTRRTAITHQGRAGVTEKDSMASTGHKTFGVHRGYDQDEDAAIRTGEALNDYIAGGHKQPSTTTTTVQPTGNLDNMAQLIAWFKEDLLTEEEFKAAKAKLL
jgi:hypothetical protein